MTKSKDLLQHVGDVEVVTKPSKTERLKKWFSKSKSKVSEFALGLTAVCGVLATGLAGVCAVVLYMAVVIGIPVGLLIIIWQFIMK